MKNTSDITEIRALVARLDPSCRQLISESAELSYKKRHATLDIEHLLSIMFSASEQALLDRLTGAGLDLAMASKQLERALANASPGSGLPPALSSQLVDVLRDAWLMVSLKNKDGLVDSATLLVAIVANKPLYDRLCESLPALRKFSISVFFSPHEDAPLTDDLGANEALKSGSALSRFTVDLNARVTAGLIDPVVGREREISQLIEILLRRRQNNPILTGEAGVGKTAIVEGLAQHICAGLVPQALKDVVIHSLDMGLLKAGAGVRGEIESRLKQIMTEIATSARPIILFIDEAHTLVGGSSGSGEHNDIANLVKPELARGTMRTIAATTWSEYKRYFEKDAALSRRFQVIKVMEPTPEEAQQILQGLIPALQKHHGVYVLQSAIGAAVNLSSRYIQGRQLPDKAISVLDTACARAVAALSGPAMELLRLQQQAELLRGELAATEREVEWGEATPEQLARLRLELQTRESQLVALTCPVPAVKAKARKGAKTAPIEPLPVRVGPADIASVIADWTGVPSQQMLADQCTTVLGLEQLLSQRVVGQPRAIQLICNRIQAYTARLDDPSRPIGVFMLAGSSGVGKTETAHALADAFFGGDHSITVINMSEYQEAHTVSKLKGAPPGYVGFGQGGTLTEAIRRRPYGLLLLDEIEKAHPDVLDLFLQVFDKGFMEDAEGIKVDFKNTLIMLTSNAGSELFEQLEGDMPDAGEVRDAFERRLHEHLATHFRAAFLGRVHVVSFLPLQEENIRRIVLLRLELVRKRFSAVYETPIDFSKSLIDLIVARCINRSVGARLIDQFVAENVLARLSSYVLDRMAKRLPLKALRVTVVGGQVVLDHESA
jgi:type VI secretion system protein VasG